MGKTDIQIAQEAQTKPIESIAADLAIATEAVIPYGHDKAKIELSANDLAKNRGKLILVTAINPTAAGEGKTTVAIGLADGLCQIGRRSALALREPSLGPVFGVKGGATGGGYAQVVPMEDLNLHFTGDMHAIGAANNLIAATIDNHIKQGNELQIDSRRVTWRRVVDMNDRQLREIVSGLGGVANGVPRQDGFDITAASEIMAILCLADSLKDLKERLSRIVIGQTFTREFVTVADLEIVGAVAALLKDAIKPNLVQTLEGTPAFVHGGPFANIAHGCNSVIATKMALAHADYVVTEAGFGGDLGGEKFMDIKCRFADIDPAAVVIVATIRALKLHGGADKKHLAEEDTPALQKGFSHLLKHVENMRDLYQQNVIVAINAFDQDSEAETQLLTEFLGEEGIPYSLVTSWADGGVGASDLAQQVVTLADQDSHLAYPYELSDSVVEKVQAVVQKVYGGLGVKWSKKALLLAKKFERSGYDKLPICIAKTQYSLSDDGQLIGRPEGFEVSVQDLTLSAGAGFIVVMMGNIVKMPGLPKRPAAQQIEMSDDGLITGLF